ncbi:hypothetical protein AAAC10_02450 [Pseudomonas aeruginosa]
MNPTISPLEFLLTNVICFAAGAVVVVALQLAGKAADFGERDRAFR